MVSEDFKKQIKGYVLTTARVWYYYPDFPQIISENWLLWQDYDLLPELPALNSYLGKGGRSDGIHTQIAFVQVMHNRLIKPAELRAVGGEFRLH